MPRIVEVFYSCDGCGLEDRKVFVRPRQTGEDLLSYIEKEVGEAVGLDHGLRSPRCQSRRMRDLKIPMDERGVGYEK